MTAEPSEGHERRDGDLRTGPGGEFPKIRGTLLWGCNNKDPTIRVLH